MIYLLRVCIPITFDCNFKCKYCFREIPHNNILPNITDEFKEYLKNLDQENCEAVAVTGGEPLLKFNLIKEIFSYVRPEMHKKIISNGSLLTKEIVNYMNDNNIEFALSYDGPNTKYLRGVNVLDDPKILELVKKIKNLTLNMVVAKGNENIYENYLDMINRLKRNDFTILIGVCHSNGNNQYLLNGFNYSLFRKSLIKYYNNKYFTVPLHYSKRIKYKAINMLLNGDIVDMTTLTKLGTINDNIEDIDRKLHKLPSMKFCNSYIKCPIRDTCNIQCQVCDYHMAKTELIKTEVKNLLGIK